MFNDQKLSLLIILMLMTRYFKAMSHKKFSVNLNVAKFTREEIDKNLLFKLKFFRNATQKLREKYVSNLFILFQLDCCLSFVINYKWEKLIQILLWLFR